MNTQGDQTLPMVSPAGVRAAALSHQGKVRDHNEDAYVAVPDLDLYVVADGMGGHAGGETASRIVVEVLPEVLQDRLIDEEETDEDRCELLRTTLRDLSCRVREEAERRIGLTGMGATVVMAVVRDGRATIAHMGDSRAYHVGPAGLSRLTEDHSVVGILLRQGEIDEAEARDHPARGRITRYVGMDDDVDPDLTTVDFGDGERLLLCTDGLTNEAADSTIHALLAQTAGDPGAACRALLDAALAGAARDNVTALVLERVQPRADRHRPPRNEAEQ